jgi:hypothetical protein
MQHDATPAPRQLLGEHETMHEERSLVQRNARTLPVDNDYRRLIIASKART